MDDDDDNDEKDNDNDEEEEEEKEDYEEENGENAVAVADNEADDNAHDNDFISITLFHVRRSTTLNKYKCNNVKHIMHYEH